MKFRPCIDIHNGKVKQIVGGSLTDTGDFASDNFISDLDAAWYAGLYRERGLGGGHVIILNPAGSPYYEADLDQALKALKTFPGGLMAGGGINSENAAFFIDAGASHVIVTSYVFRDGKIYYDNLRSVVSAVGKDRLVLDLSCRKREGQYFIVTDRWQHFTDTVLNADTLDELSEYCSEFLIHAVDVEGSSSGIDEELASLLGNWQGIPVTYAGGVGSMKDVEKLKTLGQGRLDVTIGSALDIFGGTIPFERVCEIK